MILVQTCMLLFLPRYLAAPFLVLILGSLVNSPNKFSEHHTQAACRPGVRPRFHGAAPLRHSGLHWPLLGAAPRYFRVSLLNPLGYQFSFHSTCSDDNQEVFLLFSRISA